MSGSQGTKGTRNARGRSGCLRRRKITPSDTRTKANNVPMFERSAASPMSTSPAGIPTAKQAIQVDQCGVLNLGCTAEKSLGRSPSLDMAYQIRAWPYWNTSIEEIMPISAPSTITERKIGCAPRTFSAYATGASAASPETNVVYLSIPSSTMATPTYKTVHTISDAIMPNGTQLDLWTNIPPTTRKVRMAPILISTITLLASADSRTPRTRSNVRIKTIKNPGRLKYAPVHPPEAHTGLDHLSER